MLNKNFLVFTLSNGLALFFAGCTHSLHQVHVSDFSPTYQELSRGRVVQAKAEQFTILGFVMNTDYADQAYAKLKSACPKGAIQGITTHHLTSHGFLSWTNTIEMQGLCVE
jgi:hypothetical protein